MNDSALVITVRLPLGTYHGHGDTGAPEWPPAPGRLFQALVAAAGDQRTDAEAAALRWLERRAPPLIEAPEVALGSARRSYVPNNDRDRHRDELTNEAASSRTLKVVRAVHLPKDAVIRYIWPIAGDRCDQVEAERVAALAGRIRALGWGIDFAVGHGRIVEADSSASSPEGSVRWWPQRIHANGTRLRVAISGTLSGLDADHRALRRRIEGGTQTLTDRSAPFDRIGYRTEWDLPPRPVRVFALVAPDGSYKPFWPAKARDVAAMLRHQAHEAARLGGWDTASIRGYICGHGRDGEPPPDERLSYLPLPSIGMRHTDGLIRRIALADAPGADGRRLHELADRLIGRRLVPEGGSAPAAALAQPDARDNVVRRYVERATVWASVTPVVLPGFNDRGHRDRKGQRVTPEQAIATLNGRTRKTHKLVLRTLREAGVPIELVDEVWLQKLPLWPNLPRAEKPVRPVYLRQRPAFHVRLRFKQPVHGPITLGAGRFVGFGTLSAVPGD